MSNNEKIKFFANEYNERAWKRYVNDFEKIDVSQDLLDVLPEDVLRPLIYLLGEDYTKKWINMKFENLDNQTPIELAKTKEGRMALKAFIMRIPC